MSLFCNIFCKSAKKRTASLKYIAANIILGDIRSIDVSNKQVNVIFVGDAF